jgi:hypothetical protein
LKSGFELEMSVAWARERLLAEAEADRLSALSLRRRPPNPGLRIRLATVLYALADWLRGPEVVLAQRLH